MKLEAVLHIPMSEYAYGLDETHIVYKIRTAKNDIDRVILNYGDTACRVNPIIFTPVEMQKTASDKLFDYWEAVVQSEYNRVYYYFDLFDAQGHIYYYGHLFTDKLVDDRSQYFKLPINHRADIAAVPAWVNDAVVYNIFPDSFASGRRSLSGIPEAREFKGEKVSSRLGGTLWGVAENVDYLVELGINCVYINPIFAAGEYHKYDIISYYHVDPCFGGNEAMRHMVKTLHEHNIKVIIDGVFNHCGWHFFAFDDVVKNQEKSRYCDWFYHLEFPVKRPDDPETIPSYAAFAYERMMPKLATDNEEVRNYFCEVGSYWIREFDIDGWRLDVASEVNNEFWRAFRKAVKQEKPDALLIGEVWESAAYWLNGDMFDSTMNYDLRKHAELFFAEGSIDAEDFAARVTHMLTRYRRQVLPAQLNLLDSHDVSRFLSLCGGDISKFKLAVLFMMSFVGMPTVFYGDEQGIMGVAELDYRAAMPWAEQNRGIFEFFKKAIALRKSLAALRCGEYRIRSAERDSGFLAVSRSIKGERVTVCLNAGSRAQSLQQEKGRLIWSEGASGGSLDAYGFAIFVDKE